MQNHRGVIIVGGGQAGLAMSYCLKERGIDHLIFEKNKIGHAWENERWDSFCLVTPNWQCCLPGFPYAGPDPQGFMKKDEIVEYIQAYARFVDPSIQEGVAVEKLTRHEDGDFVLETSSGTYTANQVVIATGGYHQPRIPRFAERLPSSIHQIHSSQYKNPESLPDGDVMVVGTGQSGCQIAEDLHLAGRQVHLSVGSAPRAPRRYRGKDVVDWLDMMGYYDLPIDQHPQKEQVRHKTNHYVTGRDGGHEIDLRHFALEGMKLYGRLESIEDPHMTMQPNLKQNLDQADAVAESIKKTIDGFIVKHQIEAPTEPAYQPVWEPSEEILQLNFREAGIASVIWCTSFSTNYRWVHIPVFDGTGYPSHERGVSSVSGLYFLGLPWLYTWGSGRFSGVARDAQYLADYIVTRERLRSATVLNTAVLGS